MKLTKEILKTIYLRGENLEQQSQVDDILNSCLRSAINGHDFNSYKYDEKNEEEVGKMNGIADELNKLGFEVHFDGDDGHMYMHVSWD